MSCVITESMTDGFIEEVKVAAVYVECEGEFLFLRRRTPPHFAGEWCVPGGKVEKGEEILMGAKRELEEETGIQVASQDLTYIKPLYFSTIYNSFGFYIHYIALDHKPQVVLSEEHDQAVWVNEEGVLKLDIMLGGLEPFLHLQRALKARENLK